jgi:hypothetical protein
MIEYLPFNSGFGENHIIMLGGFESFEKSTEVANYNACYMRVLSKVTGDFKYCIFHLR